jgi:hypothetical protein
VDTARTSEVEHPKIARSATRDTRLLHISDGVNGLFAIQDGGPAEVIRVRLLEDVQFGVSKSQRTVE